MTSDPAVAARDWGAGDQRIIAGLSMGGFGARSYAARHPDLFDGAASFSGALHILEPGFQMDEAILGSKADDLAIWKAHDPVSLAPALEGKTLYVSYGDGQPGALDETADEEMAELEAFLRPQNDAFIGRLEQLGVPVTVDFGPGTHTWPYWERGLHEALPLLMGSLEG